MTFHPKGERLRSLTPGDAENAFKQAEGLTLLDYDEDIYRLLRQAERAYGSLPPLAYFYWGAAAANLQRWTEAGRHLQRAQSFGLDYPLLGDMMQAVRRRQPGPHLAARYPYTHSSDLVPREAVEEMTRLVKRDEKRNRRDARAWACLLEHYPLLVKMARKMLYEDPQNTTAAIYSLASLRTKEALDTLQEFAQRRRGELEDRMEALHTLAQIGALPDGTVLKVWMKEEQHPIEVLQQEISDQFVPDYPQEAWETYEEALTAHRKGKVDAAERAYQRMLAIEPQTKEAYNNPAAIYAQRGDMDKANEYVDKALEIDPLYAFPRTSRAAQALARDDVEAAKEWLEPLHRVRQWHPLAFVAYQKAMAQVAMAEKEFEAARNHLEVAQGVKPDDQQIDDLLERLSVVETFAGVPRWWREMADKYRARRQKKPLSPDPTLADCFGLLTKGDMVGIRHLLNIQGISALKKAT